MREILPRLAIGAIGDHKPTGPEWSVVCACREPCYRSALQARRGVRQVPRVDPDFIAVEEENRLCLNLVDPPTAVGFERETFTRFTSWARAQWLAGRSLLIHDDKGESRAPTLAIVFLAKVLGEITDDSFDQACDGFERLIESRT